MIGQFEINVSVFGQLQKYVICDGQLLSVGCSARGHPSKFLKL